jgi:hypothetical protein
MKKIHFLIPFVLFLIACGTGTPPPPVNAGLGEVFTLTPGQSAKIDDAEMTITLVGVPGDERCPLDIECNESGPVTVTITVQSGSEAPKDFTLQSFTDNDGSVPEMDFEGMTASIETNGFVIRLKSVLPFPRKSVAEIGEYRVSFAVK